MYGNDTTNDQTNSTSTASVSSDSTTTDQSSPVLGLDASTVPAAPAIASDGTITPAETMAEPASAPSEVQSDMLPPVKPEEPSAAGELAASGSDDLMTIKKEALNNLTPLIDKLDQTPAENFKTIMMMIQASDDKTLVRRAYEVANQIEDDKLKAQALLDVINEINYFTTAKE